MPRGEVVAVVVGFPPERGVWIRDFGSLVLPTNELVQSVRLNIARFLALERCCDATEFRRPHEPDGETDQRNNRYRVRVEDGSRQYSIEIVALSWHAVQRARHHLLRRGRGSRTTRATSDVRKAVSARWRHPAKNSPDPSDVEFDQVAALSEGRQTAKIEKSASGIAGSGRALQRRTGPTC